MPHVSNLKFCEGTFSLEKFCGARAPSDSPGSTAYDNQRQIEEHILVVQEKERKANVKFIKITQKQCLLPFIFLGKRF